MDCKRYTRSDTLSASRNSTTLIQFQRAQRLQKRVTFIECFNWRSLSLSLPPSRPFLYCAVIHTVCSYVLSLQHTNIKWDGRDMKYQSYPVSETSAVPLTHWWTHWMTTYLHSAEQLSKMLKWRRKKLQHSGWVGPQITFTFTLQYAYAKTIRDVQSQEQTEEVTWREQGRVEVLIKVPSHETVTTVLPYSLLPHQYSIPKYQRVGRPLLFRDTALVRRWLYICRNLLTKFHQLTLAVNNEDRVQYELCTVRQCWHYLAVTSNVTVDPTSDRSGPIEIVFYYFTLLQTPVPSCEFELLLTLIEKLKVALHK